MDLFLNGLLLGLLLLLTFGIGLGPRLTGPEFEFSDVIRSGARLGATDKANVDGERVLACGPEPPAAIKEREATRYK